MKVPTSMPRLKELRNPREIIACAVWSYHHLALSTADVEDLLASRGVIANREAIRLWINRVGKHFANCIRRDRPRPHDKWHMDFVVTSIRGRKHRLRRAIDAIGDTLDVLVQTRRNAKAARRFFQTLVDQFGEPRVVITISHDTAGQCTVGHETSCAAIPSRLTSWLRTRIIAPTKA